MISTEAVVNLISSTTTETGLTVNAVLDKNEYKTGIKVTKQEMKSINLFKGSFYPEWNDSIKPNRLSE